MHIPFELATNGPATKVVLYSSFDGGEWQEQETARPGQKKGFLFRADREGTYWFATMTHFADGRTDPPRKEQLTEQKRVVFDKTPPRINTLRATMAADGAPGIEWDVQDEFMAPKGIALEFRWDGQGAYRPLDENYRFAARDSRHWKMRPDDRMQVRLVATDRAGNKTESDPIWVSARDAEHGGGPVPKSSAVAGTTTGVREPEPIQRVGARAQANLTYLNTKSVALNISATVGPSGLGKAYLYYADEKLEWNKWKDEVGPLPAPPVSTPDSPRRVPVNFNFKAEKDGLYHFIIVVESHRGTNRRVPKKGDPGDVQVMVDTTKPEVQLDPPKVLSNGDRGAVVDIRWKASDANIAALPIKLEYAAVSPDRREEPKEWKAITENWIDNSGQHTWPAPSGEAYLFLIRVTCRDRAGNETTTRTHLPVNVDLEVPKVEGIDVAPDKGGAGAPGASRNSGISDIPKINVGPGPSSSKDE